MSVIGEQLHPSALVGGVTDIAKRMLRNTAPGRYVTGSSSPAYVRLDSSKRPDIDPDSIAWHTLHEDPEAGNWPRHRHNVGVLATSHSLYKEIHPDYLKTPGKVKDAIAWLAEGVVRIGTSPNSDNLFGGGYVDGQNQLAVARRLERSPVNATLGLLLVEDGQFIQANPVTVVENSLPVDEMRGDRFRHVPVV